MNLPLTNYQDQAVTDVLDALNDAVARFQKNGKTTAVSLTAVTGAGKTVMAAAALEALLNGNDQVDPDPSLTVLWLTDDPSLNEQTRRKMLVASDLIAPKQYVTIDERLDQRTLSPATIYFLNIHKLGKGATNYVRGGTNFRQHSLWDIIRQTIRERGSSFLLVIDEAHRGTSGGNGERKTIAGQLIEGDPGTGTPAAPIVLGISATPERFRNAISGSGRVWEEVGVDVDEVRKSGLIKDLVDISFPTETQPSDATLVAKAVEELLEFDEQWASYTEPRDIPPVRPALVVQVRAGATDNDLRAVLDTVHAAWDGLEDNAIGHSFQEHARLDLGKRSVRYIAPQDIQDDPQLRVVLFKEALTTGWDCPRAEVMVSLRKASDHTYIAQLIGRMVRTPLARRISASEALNRVALYLPHFNEDSVEQVVSGLRSGEDQIASQVTTNSVVCKRNTKLPAEVWEVAATLPTYTRPAKTHRNEVARLNAFAQLLASTDVDKGAPKKAREHVVATMKREADRLGEGLAATISELSKLELRTRRITPLDVGEDDIVLDSSTGVDDRNVEDLFRQARRRFGDAAAQWYWNAICNAHEDAGEDVDPIAAKLRVAALAEDHAAVTAVHEAASTLVATLRSQHASEIGKLNEADRDRMYLIFQQSRDPQLIGIILPDDVSSTAPKEAARYPKHLYANGGGKYPASFNDWEEAVLETHLPISVAWYRNPSAGSRALAVPYTIGGEPKTMYPDFVFFRDTADGVVADIIDPHDPSRSDTAPKWNGLAAYAAKHKEELGQVLAVIKAVDGEMWSLDLRDANVVAQLAKAAGEADIRKVFADYGGRL